MTRRTLAPDAQPTITLGARVPVQVAFDWRAAAAAADMSVSDWLRQAVEAGRTPVTGLRRPGLRHARRASDPELLLALARWGNLLNQLAHQAHRGALAGRRVEVLHVLVQIQAELRRIGSSAAADEGKA